jgi:hypothetical protein
MTTKDHGHKADEKMIPYRVRLRESHLAALRDMKEPKEMGAGWHIRRAVEKYLEGTK